MIKFKVGDKVKIEATVASTDEGSKKPICVWLGEDQCEWLTKSSASRLELIKRPRKPGWYLVKVDGDEGIHCRYWDGLVWTVMPGGQLACRAAEEADFYSWISERIEVPEV